MNKNKITFIFLVLFLIIWIFILIFIGPNKIVDFLGVENSYLILFLIAAIGGLSTLTGSVYYTSLITFSAAGLNPFILSVIGGIGLTISDSIFYYFGRVGRDILPDKIKRNTNKFYKWLKSKPQWTLPIFVYAYTGFTPFPSDIMLIAIALIKINFKKIVIPLLLGNMTSTLLISLFVQLF